MIKKAFIILPTYNESANIARLIHCIFSANKNLASYDFEILVADDDSPDGTGKIVAEIAKANTKVHLLNGKKEGLGKAYQRGFTYVIENYDSDIIIMMDADFSHDPEDLPRLISAIDEGADYVVGSRYARGGAIPGNWPLLRIVNSRVANQVARKLGGIDTKILEITGGFRAIRTEALMQIDYKGIKTSGYAFLMHLLNEFIKKSFDIREVPITFSERTHGSSKIRAYDILEFLKCAYGLNVNSPAKQLLRFVTVGVVGTVVNLTALFFLASVVKINLLLASAVSIEVSIISNFILHCIYTFKQAEVISAINESSGLKPIVENPKSSLIKKFGLFNFATLGVVLLTLVGFTFFHGVLGLHYLIAQFLAIGTSFSANYLLSSRLVWKKHVVA